VACIHGRVRRKWTPGQCPGPRPPWITLYGEIASPDGPQTAGAKRRSRDLLPEYDRLMGEMETVLGRDLDAFNAGLGGKNAPAVIPPKPAVRK